MSSNSTASPPPNDDSSGKSSPPPPSSSTSPPLQSQKSPPPSSPPPSNNIQSPPPPSSSDGGDESSPPPPSSGVSSSSPPPPQQSSPPPPSSDDDDGGGDSQSPPPPPSKNNSPYSPPPPPRSSFNPPSSGALSPPPPPHSPSSNKSPSTSSSPSGPSQETITKIAVGSSLAVVLLLIMLVISCVCATKKKKKRKQEAMHYYGAPSKGSEQYFNSSQHPTWHNQQDHVVKLPPPPTSLGMPSSGGWPAQPPPPPPMMTSSEMSSNFSGPRHPPLPPPSPNLHLGFNKSTFSYEELAAATGNFSQANLLGQGGFGYVHKGVFPNGKEVAIKSLKSGSGQGEREFQAEVEIISRVHHRHLVSLVGYCIAGGQRMLVYEFVPNKTLEYHLHATGRPVMDFPIRLRIALGSAKGLAYLHEDCHPRIIHRDIKTANILIDYNFEAMVADFGLAKLSSDTNTHVSTRVMGTFGYLAPEYAASGKLTEKSDVFSYGVMLLELITGKRPVDNTNMMEDSLVDWARPLCARAIEDGNYDELVDPRLENNYNPQEMARMVACASASIRHSARRRPKMSQIVRALEGDVSLEDLNESTRPGQSSALGSSGSSDYDTGAYNADMKRFKKMALSSQEFSGEYGNTGEFGAHSSGEMRQPRTPY